MALDNLDDVDKGIIHLLQKDARNNTDTEIAEMLGVSASTVGNRIRQMEEDNVINGYEPDVNYEQANLPLHIMFVCSAPVSDQTELAKEAREVFGVVNVREMLSGARNVRVEAISRNFSEITETTQALDDIGLEIITSEIIKKEYTRPFDHFGSDLIDE